MASKMANWGSALIAVMVVLGLSHCATGASYLVGEPGANGGWTYVSGTTPPYDDLFKNIFLVVGDSLEFVFLTGEHNVVEVPPADVATCSDSNSIRTWTESVNVTLATAGDHGFICSIPYHCSNYGMDLLVTVHEAIAPAPAPESESAPAPESGR